MSTKYKEPSWATGFARSSSQSAHPELWDNLVGLWVPSLGPTGETLYDVSGWGNHGTLTNMSPSEDWVSKNGYSLDFDGINKYIDMPASLAHFSGTESTVVFDLTVDSYDTNGTMLIGTNSGGSHFWQLGTATQVFIASQQLNMPSFNFEDGVRRQIVMIGSTAGLSLYIDGILWASNSTSSTAVPSGSKNFAFCDWIGSLGTSWTLNGQLHECSIYNRILSFSEIQVLSQDSLAPLRQKTTVFPAAVSTKNDAFTLYLQGHSPLNSYTSLHTIGSIADEKVTTLFIDGLGLKTKTNHLYIEGTDTVVSNTRNLFLQVDPGTATLGRPLYIQNDEAYLTKTKTGFLFIEGAYATTNNRFPLYLQNDSITSGMTLYIRTPSGLKNAVPFSKSAPLFINRPDESISFPLFLKAFDAGANSYISLYLRNHVESTATMTLAMPNVASIPINSYATLMIEGAEPVFDSMDLVIYDAHGTLNSTMSLMIKQETVSLNSYTTLYSKGVEGLPNSNITLAMPDTHDSSLLTFPLYVFGW